MYSFSERTLYIDTKDLHLEDENAFTIHPSKLNFLAGFQKEFFDRAFILNTPSGSISSLGLFYIAQTLKQNGELEILVDQPISVMQSLDASEIEANAKLAGFADIMKTPFEKFVRDGDRDVKITSVKVSMVKPEKILNDGDKSVVLTRSTLTLKTR